MKITNNILETIGNTPLIKINRLNSGLKPQIYAKCEMFNPGGSIKDRPTLKMIEEAEAAGLLKPGATIIEPTSGNTGVGLAQIAAVKGYKCILVAPDKVSSEKINLLKAYGAQVVIVPTSVMASSHESYYSVANRLCAEIPNSFQPNQFANPNNPKAHCETTGKEIWDQTDGKITCFVAGMGTGGSLNGIASYLKEKNPNILIVASDPEGSILSGDLAKPYKVEGIGEDYIPKNVNLKLIDEFIRVSDKDSFLMARKIAESEGILVGGSSGTSMVAALQIASKLGKDDCIVVLFTDGGRGYLSKIYNDDWMKEQGYLPSGDNAYLVKDLLAAKTTDNIIPSLVYVRPSDTIKSAIEKMHKHQLSQIPVLDENGTSIGHINDFICMQIIYSRKDPSTIMVTSVMGKPYPEVDHMDEVEYVYKIFSQGHPLVTVTNNSKVVGVLTKADIIDYLQLKMRDEDKSDLMLNKI